MKKKKEKNLQTSKKAFTLAEVLITLAIIGVVAAMTIPTLIADYNQRSWDTATSVFNRRLGEALKVMNANSTLAGYTTTQEFVNELGENIKILRTCDSDHLTDCFTETINTGADPIDTTKLKKSKNLYSTEDYGTETIGVQFADGVTALIAYNPNVKEDPYNNSNDENSPVAVTGTGKSVGLSTKALSILYDVSGSKNPNSFGTGKDIKGINIDINTGANIHMVGINYSPVDCSDSTSEGYEYCDAKDIAKASEIGDNYLVGARYACAKQNMSLPTKNELEDLYKEGEFELPTTGGVYGKALWTSTYSGMGDTYGISFHGINNTGHSYRNVPHSVLCVGD